MELENLNIVFDGEEYMEKLHCGVAQASPITVVIKDNCTDSGKPGVLVSFLIEKDGNVFPVQATTTARLFVAAARAIMGRHPDLLD